LIILLHFWEKELSLKDHYSETNFILPKLNLSIEMEKIANYSPKIWSIRNGFVQFNNK